MTKDAKIQEIAAMVLGLETLATRNSDGQDFHEISVWSLRAALSAAYDAGREYEVDKVLRAIAKND